MIQVSLTRLKFKNVGNKCIILCRSDNNVLLNVANRKARNLSIHTNIHYELRCSCENKFEKCF